LRHRAAAARRAERNADPRGAGRLDRGSRLPRPPRVHDRRGSRRPLARAAHILGRSGPVCALALGGDSVTDVGATGALEGSPFASPSTAAPLTRRLMSSWHVAAVGAVLALASFLDFFRLDRNGYANTYYSAAVRSMLRSWHNFFFVSFDPGGLVSVDKP